MAGIYYSTKLYAFLRHQILVEGLWTFVSLPRSQCFQFLSCTPTVTTPIFFFFSLQQLQLSRYYFSTCAIHPFYISHTDVSIFLLFYFFFVFFSTPHKLSPSHHTAHAANLFIYFFYFSSFSPQWWQPATVIKI